MARRPPHPKLMIVSVEDAQQRILARFSPLPATELELHEAHGLVLARDIVAPHDVPPFANSAMDGYALRAEDTRPAALRPVELEVIGVVQAGDEPAVALSAGQAARIMTGAALPPGADAVVRFEDVRASGATVQIERPARERENIRKQGEDFKRGATVLSAGRRLLAAEIGALAALGIARAEVYRRPRVGVLSTGDEVIQPGEVLKPGQIYDCNAPMLAALVREWGGEPVMLGVAGDTLDSLRAQLRSEKAIDLLVTSGGVSVGEFDLLSVALRELGEVEEWQVLMKPGKPLVIGEALGVPLLGLPGNPVAALVAFVQFGRPALMRMSGRRELFVSEVEAVLMKPINNRGGRTLFARGELRRDGGVWTVTPSDAQGSAQLSGLLGGNALVVIPSDVEALEVGASVCVQVLDTDSLFTA